MHLLEKAGAFFFCRRTGGLSILSVPLVRLRSDMTPVDNRATSAWQRLKKIAPCAIIIKQMMITYARET
jgi:hypothetical protein